MGRVCKFPSRSPTDRAQLLQDALDVANDAVEHAIAEVIERGASPEVACAFRDDLVINLIGKLLTKYETRLRANTVLLSLLRGAL
jgi:hypothetical protein